MRVKRRIDIRVETHQVLAIRKPCREVVARCAGCGRKVRMMTLDEAMALSGAGSRETPLEAGKIHFTEIDEGFVLICLTSLLKSN